MPAVHRRTQRGGTLLLALVAVVSFTGCALHRQRADDARVPLDTFIAQVRKLSAEARPARENDADTLERRDPDLAAARLALTLHPSADSHRRVAEEYVRLGVLDLAHDHFSAAIRLEGDDAASYDGRARVWREWGFANLGLADANRAVYYAPESAVARNTLGTLLLKLGLLKDARSQFEQALARDPQAGYILNNLCYVSVLQGASSRAIDWCGRALKADPELKAARNNLALAYASAGNFAAAAREFADAASGSTVQYNVGIAFLATRHFEDAAHAFDRAAALSPTSTLPQQRAKQARLAAAAAQKDTDAR
jgi:tetratricopeptide (TPR) repeat protein